MPWQISYSVNAQVWVKIRFILKQVWGFLMLTQAWLHMELKHNSKPEAIQEIKHQRRGIFPSFQIKPGTSSSCRFVSNGTGSCETPAVMRVGVAVAQMLCWLLTCRGGRTSAQPGCGAGSCGGERPEESSGTEPGGGDMKQHDRQSRVMAQPLKMF